MFLGKNKFFIRLVTTLTTVGVLVGSIPLSSHAATFSHKHTDACYKTVTKTCSDHEWRHGREVRYRECPTCKTTTRCIYDTYKDTCMNNLVGDNLSKWDIYCETCGTMIETRDANLSSHKYKTTELSCGMKESSVAASVSVTAGTTGWTNKNVTVSCNVDISDSTFSLAGAPYSFNGGAFGGNSSYEVSENGSYSFTVKDSNGRTVTESINIGNIDKKAPTVSLSKSTDDWTESGLTISASASDDLSGIASQGYSFGGDFSSSNSIFVNSNGTYSVTVRDNAGNTSSASITISNIGKDPKKIEEEKRKQEEEEKKKKEEEEKKKQEEERKKSEEEKKKEDDSKKKDDGDKDKKDDSGTDIKDKKDDSGDNIKDKNPEDKKTKKDDGEDNEIVSLVYDDVSDNDISGDDVSGNLIPVDSDFPEGGNSKWIEKSDTASNQAPLEKNTLWMKLSHLDTITKLLLSGIALLLFAFAALSTLDFVYSKNDGKITPVTFAKVKSDKKKMFVKIPSGVLDRDKKYSVFLSLKSRLKKRGKTVVVDVDGHNPQYISDDGCSFVYNG